MECPSSVPECTVAGDSLDNFFSGRRSRYSAHSLVEVLRGGSHSHVRIYMYASSDPLFVPSINRINSLLGGDFSAETVLGFPPLR